MQHSAHSRRGRAKFQGDCHSPTTRGRVAGLRAAARIRRDRSRSIESVRRKPACSRAGRVTHRIFRQVRAMTLTGCSRCAIDHAARPHCDKPAPRDFFLCSRRTHPQPARTTCGESRLSSCPRIARGADFPPIFISHPLLTPRDASRSFKSA